ncbi:MAG: Glycosyltransferase [bacterium P3]|nr:MAG: Glycosyltransferase [bacterium P3]KWW42697.1 MAG: Glycosyltransferase [bacterium F083]
MIIGFDAKRAFRNNTGLGNYSRMLICSLASAHQDVQVILYAPQMSGYYKSFFSSYANISTRQPRGWRSLLPSLWRGFGISRHLQGDRVNIYHGLSHELPHLIPSRIRRVVTIHDLVAWRYPQYFNVIDAFIHRVKMRHSCHSADIVVAISEQTKNDIIHYLHIPESKIRVLYQSCDEIFWQPVTEEDIASVRQSYHLPDRYIISVGTVEERKNQLAIIEALSRLPEWVHLVLVGRSRGRYGRLVRRSIEEKGLSQRVHWLTDARFSDFPALYAASSAAAYMSFFEGFGIPILEAMCSGTVVLTSNCSSMPEVGGDAVLYADPRRSDEIAAQLLRLLTDDVLRADLLSRSRQRIQRFTAEKIGDDFYRLYVELYKGGV